MPARASASLLRPIREASLEAKGKTVGTIKGHSLKMS